MNKKDKKIGNLSIRLEKDLLDKYKQHCDKNGFDMSKRLRIFIESEIQKEYSLIKVDDILYEPNTEIEIITLMGFNFPSFKLSPKVFIIKTSDLIEKNIEFYRNNIRYRCDNVKILKDDNNEVLIECSKFTIEYLYNLSTS